MSPEQSFSPESSQAKPIVGQAAELSPTSPAQGGVWDNPIIGSLPNHLKQFIVDQQYESYTAIDHAVWRYVMRQNYDFLRRHAHESYTGGLARTGIDIESIPSIATMNEILGQIGWAAVTVDGFIPPAAFMEFQSYQVLVIAADIRSLEHIEYTPAPDIIHEAAGHAPIIADQQYADYLKRFGEIGAKAMSSKKDYELYEAIRHLSILKEKQAADPGEIKRAEQEVAERQDNLGEPSEMALLSRLHWWTVEYGLIGTLEAPRIFGAGLLSSIGESANCLTDQVKKLPFGIGASEYAFDIVNQQPQLFVTPDFEHLTNVLEKFADTMAFSTGGTAGLAKALECQNLATFVLSSGALVSGVVRSYDDGPNGQPSLVQTSGPTMLAYGNKELIDGSKELYADGLCAPIGNLAGCESTIEDMTDDQLRDLGIIAGHKGRLEFGSGLVVEGSLDQIVRRSGKIILFEISEGRISRGEAVAYDLGAATYHLPVGEKVISVFGSAADKNAFEPVSLVPRERTLPSAPSEQKKKLGLLYRAVRRVREKTRPVETLDEIWKEHQAEHPYDWLLAVELLELLSGQTGSERTAGEIKTFLAEKMETNKQLIELINSGLSLIEKAGNK